MTPPLYCSASLLISALLLVACGPPRIGVGDVGGETDTATTTTGEPMTSTADSETSTTTSTTEEPTFLPKLDSHVPDSCDVLLQDCLEGEKCVPYVPSMGSYWGEDFKCVPVSGDRKTGESCNSAGAPEATDDCDADSYCWNYLEDGVGTCHAFCEGTYDDLECAPGSRCQWYIFVCIPVCDPIIQDCPPGLACHYDGSLFTCDPTSQDIPTGEPCGFLNDCAAGNFCLSARVIPDCLGASCCTSYCDINLGDAQCNALPGTVCLPFFEEGTAPPDYEHVGVCVLPPDMMP